MKALILQAPKIPIFCQETTKPVLTKGQVLVKLKAAGINHRDVYITQGLYPGVVTPVILGSDGAGEIVELGEGVEPTWLHQSVVLNPSIGWEAATKVQPKNYKILGMPDNGCFAEYIAVDVKQVNKKPNHLSFEQAAALPLAGLTAYRALFSRAQVQKNERVLISGVGGGVALLACQFAIAAGAEVFVTSGSAEKIDQAIALGAKGGVNYKEENWHKTLLEKAEGGFDVIVDSAGGDGFKYFLDLANMGGRIVFYGGTRGSFKVNPQKVFWKQLSLLGSTMGNTKEFGQMLDFVAQTKLIPVVDRTWKLEEGAAAFDYMDQGKQFGKIVFTID
jgi:NADPH:quinone reductase-like Zn-dependent oxidoreductase